MDVKIVDLYKYCGLPKENGWVGELTCLNMKTPDVLGVNRRRPAILVIPGGGYEHVSPREGEPIAMHFMTRGYAAFVLNYTVAPAVKAAFPMALREAAMAMRYIRENADAYEIDPDMVAATGFSAGGHLCGTLGMLYDCPEVADIGSPELIRPSALGLNYPVIVSWGATHEGSFINLTGGDQTLRERLSLEKCVRSDMPPVFLWHTRDDDCVPVRNSLLLACAMEEKGVRFAMHIYRSGWHGLGTADHMVYASWVTPGCSWDVPGWLDVQMKFFADCGLKIHDTER